MMKYLEYEKLEVCFGEGGDDFVKVLMVPYTKQKDDIVVSVSADSEEHKRFLERACAKGGSEEVYVFSLGADKVVVLSGTGDVHDADIPSVKSNFKKSGASAFSAVKNYSSIEISLASEQIDKNFIYGIILASYQYRFFMKGDSYMRRISINSSSLLIKKAISVANAQNFARFLADTPANMMTPTLFAKYAMKHLQGKKNVSIEVFGQKFMKKLSMNLILGVSRGSVEKPRFVVAKYRGRDGDGVDVSLVGKGVCFDSGGMSLKSCSAMIGMKGDMLGGASVLSVFGLVADAGIKINVDVIIPLVENLPSGTATKPGDVHVAMNGKSVEVENTDAEGRLILAESLVFSQNSSPTYIFCVATLTGAMSISLGDVFIGYFTWDEGLADIILQCSIDAGDPAWRMPLSNVYLDSMKSDVADIKNVGGKAGGSITAAMFLSSFVDRKFKWAHFDIAGVSESYSSKTVYGNWKTGCSVPMLFGLIEKISETVKY